MISKKFALSLLLLESSLCEIEVPSADPDGHRGIAGKTCFYSDGRNWVTDAVNIEQITPSDDSFTYAFSVALSYYSSYYCY